jgi:hypothetical protein
MDAPDAGKTPAARPSVDYAAADVRDDDPGGVARYHMRNPAASVYKQSYLAAEFAGKFRDV